MKIKLARTVSPLLLVAIFMVQSSCGPQDEQAAQNRVGPVGPTSQSKLFFDLTVTPHTVRSGSNVDVTYRVWDSAGNMASGVTVSISGVAIDPTKSFTTSGSDGLGGWVITLNEQAGSIVFVTVNVEDKSLTAPVQITSGPPPAGA